MANVGSSYFLQGRGGLCKERTENLEEGSLPVQLRLRKVSQWCGCISLCGRQVHWGAAGPQLLNGKLPAQVPGAWGWFTGRCPLVYCRNLLDSKHHWASQALLQRCNRSKKESTPEPGREAPSSTPPCSVSLAVSIGKAEYFFNWQRRHIYRVQLSDHRMGQRMADLELTVNNLITGTDRFSEAQMKEGVVLVQFYITQPEIQQPGVVGKELQLQHW